VYNPNTGTWFRITSQVFTDNISSGDSNLYPSHLFTPISPRSSAVFHLANFKMSVVESGGTNIISGQFPRGDGLYDHDTGGNRPIIPAKWRSRDLFGPEAPRTHAGVRQMFLDHTFPGDTNFGFTGVTTGWHVNLIDMSGNTLPGASFDSKIGQSSLLVDLTLRARPSIMRDYSWDFDESDDASFEVSWAGSNQGPGGGASERLYDIFGVGLTFLPGAREPLP
jgi:hypothetical protein